MKLTSKDTLKALKKQRGLSYEDIAQMAGCHRSMISQLANGTRTSCTDTLGERIALCLGVPSEVLFVATTSAGGGGNVKPKRKKAA